MNIRTIGGSYKHLCVTRLQGDGVRAGWGQEAKEIYFVLFLQLIYVQMEII